MSLNGIDREEIKRRAIENFRRRLSLISDAQKKEVLSIPKKYQGVAAKVYAKEASQTDMIKLKCLSCVGYEEAEERIGNCTIDLCGTHQSRPYQK